MGIPMLSIHHAFTAVAVIVGMTALNAASAVVAQSSNYNVRAVPDGSVGGFAGREMQRIRVQSVGTGYGAPNSANLINQTLAQGVSVGGSPTYAPRISGGAARGTGLSNQPRNKPFANASRGPTVSPYLNLFRDSAVSDPNQVDYQTLVQPQLQQQQMNNQIQQQARALGQQFQALSAQPAFNPQGSQIQSPTGHTTFFNNTLNYYPLRNRR